MNIDYKEIGVNIRKARLKCELKQYQLAERVNVSTQHISHIEQGSGKMGLALLVDVANVLNTSVDTLLGINQYSDRHRILEGQIATMLEGMPDNKVELCFNLCRAVVDRRTIDYTGGRGEPE